MYEWMPGSRRSSNFLKNFTHNLASSIKCCKEMPKSDEQRYKRPQATCSEQNKSSQSHLGRVRRYPHVGECTLPLRVLAVACTMRNKRLRDVMGALRGITERYRRVAHRYRTLWNVTERYRALRDVTERCRSVMGCCRALRTSRSVAWRYGTLRSVTKLLRNVTERLPKYQFCPSLTEFKILLITKMSACVLFVTLCCLIPPP